MRTRFSAVLVLLAVLSTHASAQVNLGGLLKKFPGSGLSEKDASLGIKDALAQGVSKAVLNLHKTDGFYGNDLYKLLLPPD